MELLKVKEARWVGDYKIEVEFSDGYRGVVDLEARLHGKVFEPLKDVQKFKTLC